MRKENEAIFSRWVTRVWSEGDERAIDELFQENAVADYSCHPESRPIEGKENYKDFVRSVRGLFTDIQVNIEQIASDQDRVIGFCTVIADRRRENDDGSIRSARIKASGLYQIIIKNGKIFQAWSNIELLGADEPVKNLASRNGG